MNPRSRLILNIFRSVLISWSTSFGLWTLLSPTLMLWLRFSLSFLSIIAFFFARKHYQSYSLRRQASRLGVHEIPKVVGKWPGNLDIILMLLKQIRSGAYVMEPLRELMKKHDCNTLNLNFLWTDFIMTMDESIIRHMLIGEGFDRFTRGDVVRDYMEPLLGSGIFASDGHQWATRRAIAKPFIAVNRFCDPDIFYPQYAVLTEVIQSMHSSGPTSPLSRAFDVQDLFRRFTTDVACTVLFGESHHALDDDLPMAGEAVAGGTGSRMPSRTIAKIPGINDFTMAFERLESVVALRTMRGKTWLFHELFHDRSEKYRKTIDDFLRPIVRRAIQEKSVISKDQTESSYLNYLVRTTDDETFVRDELVNMLFAARDGMANLLTFVVYFLCIHPDEASRLRKEVLDSYGPNSDPSLESLSRLRYLRAWLNECLRLFPPLPMNARVSSPDEAHVLPLSATESNPRRFLVPPGSQIIINSLLLQRRKDLWGENAHMFCPDRWLNDSGLEGRMKKACAYIPFNAGPRICLGQHIVILQTSLVIVKLLQQYDHFELAPDAQPRGSLPPSKWKNGDGRQALEQCWPNCAISLGIKGGLWVRCRLAS